MVIEDLHRAIQNDFEQAAFALVKCLGHQGVAENVSRSADFVELTPTRKKTAAGKLNDISECYIFLCTMRGIWNWTHHPKMFRESTYLGYPHRPTPRTRSVTRASLIRQLGSTRIEKSGLGQQEFCLRRYRIVFA